MITIPKNSREEIRVYRSNYIGRDLVNIRVFFKDVDGTYKPTRKGIAVKVELIDDLLEALKEFKRIEHEGKD